MTGQVLVADDESNLRQTLVQRLARSGYHALEAADGESALEQIRRQQLDAALIDLRMPGVEGLGLIRRIRTDQPACQVILMTAHGTVETAVEAMKLGALDYLQKPLRLAEVDVVIENAVRLARVARAAERMSAAIERTGRVGSIVGATADIQLVHDWIQRASRTAMPVLIRGETGTGKELVARAIHRASARVRAPFVAVNCGALRGELLESELFGHERGAFTGADRAKEGLFEIASGGTLFLDEIGEMRPESQVGLLRVIDSNRFRRLGGVREIEVDLRVVSATHRDLKKLVNEGTFREDLYYRLAVVEFGLPPLRDHVEDIPELMRHFASGGGGSPEPPIHFTEEALEVLYSHNWPGNVRELRNIAERLTLLAGTEPVDRALMEGVLFGGPLGAEELRVPLNPDTARQALLDLDGNKSAAARKLGISRPTLYRLLNSCDPKGRGC